MLLERRRQTTITARFMFTTFILQKGLPFSVISSLKEFTQEVSKHYQNDVLSQYSPSGKSVVKMTQRLSGIFKAELFTQFMPDFFSLSIDESSDYCGCAYLAVCAKFLEATNSKIEANFVGLVTDEGPTMVARNIGVGARLAKDYPYIVNARDSSHL